MSSSKISTLRRLLPPFRPTLGTHSPAYHIAESCHVTDMAAVFTVCLCTANSGQATVEIPITLLRRLVDTVAYAA